MDLHSLHQGQRFVWDLEKAASNVKKHGVFFEQAREVFFDPFVRLEDVSVDEEGRESATGLTEDWTLLSVVHLVREGDLIRIISARQATAQERRAYEGNG
jgi:uncharacterized DUF497 family protein